MSKNSLTHSMECEVYQALLSGKDLFAVPCCEAG